VRIFLIISLCIAVLLQSFSTGIIVMGYEINKAYIASNLCVNRAKPEMKCHGKCHLAKKVKEEEQREQAPSQPIKEKSSAPISETELPTFLFSPAVTSIEHNTLFLFPSFTAFYSVIFHPPCPAI
jgi:hypothetical protein